MEKNLYLYNGKDYWLIPRPKTKELIMVNIQSRHQNKIPMVSQKSVKENYQCWLDNQEVRLPKTFLVKAKDYSKHMIDDLLKLGVKKQKKKDLKKYLFFHNFNGTYTITHIDEINEVLIPTLDYKDIHKVASHQEFQAVDQVRNFTRKGVGLFADQIF
jgi:hypothetical protein